MQQRNLNLYSNTQRLRNKDIIFSRIANCVAGGVLEQNRFVLPFHHHLTPQISSLRYIELSLTLQKKFSIIFLVWFRKKKLKNEKLYFLHRSQRQKHHERYYREHRIKYYYEYLIYIHIKNTYLIL